MSVARQPRTAGRLAALGSLLALALVAAPGPASAQVVTGPPPEVEGIGVTQHLDAELPLDLRFTDDRGNVVRLGDLLREDRPVVLTLVYYTCPMLCHLVLDGLVSGIQELGWTPGREFDVVSVSIDHTESATDARQAKQAYLGRLGRLGAEHGWHFLTGDREAIRTLADTVGFGYQYLEDRGEFAHPAAIFVITPQGRVSRYLFGTRFPPRTLRLSLVEAGRGEIGSVVDQFLLYCFRYDAEVGQYTPVARRLMRVAAICTVLLLGAVLLTWWIRDTRSRPHVKRPA